MRLCILASAILAIIVYPSISYAEDFTEKKKAIINNDDISVNLSLGWLSGKSHEYVYNDGKKLSQLDWQIKNSPIIKGGISWDATRWLTLEANGWTTLGSRNSGMDDYDWMTPNQSHWSDWSYSPRTPLNYANEFSLNSYIWLIKQDNFKVAGALGYQQTRFSWTAIGGYYNYDNGQDIGNLPDRPGIGYKQKFSLPYVGGKVQYNYDNWEFSTLLKYSPWVLAKDNDEHYNRGLTFREKTRNSEYYSIAANVGYYMTPNLKFYSEWAWNKYTQGYGGTQMIDNSDGSSQYIGGKAAGIENRNQEITFGISYKF